MVHEIEALFDTLHSRIQPVDPALNASQIFFNSSHANFEIAQIIADAIYLFVKATQIDECQIVGLIWHHHLPA
jgi:hypothetical protein